MLIDHWPGLNYCLFQLFFDLKLTTVSVHEINHDGPDVFNWIKSGLLLGHGKTVSWILFRYWLVMCALCGLAPSCTKFSRQQQFQDLGMQMEANNLPKYDNSNLHSFSDRWMLIPLSHFWKFRPDHYRPTTTVVFWKCTLRIGTVMPIYTTAIPTVKTESFFIIPSDFVQVFNSPGNMAFSSFRKTNFVSFTHSNMTHHSSPFLTRIRADVFLKLFNTNRFLNKSFELARIIFLLSSFPVDMSFANKA